MTGKSSILLLLLVLLCSSASASLLVSIYPKDPRFETLSLYLDESGEYEISVFNNGPAEVKNVLLKVSTAGGLKVIESGVEKSTVGLTIDSIQPNAKESILLRLKPSELSTKNLFLYVDYGIAEYTHLSATYVTVKESPLQVNASLSKTALDVGDEGSVKLSLKNNGSEVVRNIEAQLIVFQGLYSLNGKVSLASLAPGEGYEAKEFVFRADPSAAGKKPLVMQVSFEDSLGRHVIEKNFSVEIQSRQSVLYLIIAVIILLVIVAIFSRGKESKAVRKLEKPIAHDLEHKGVKPPK